MECIAPQPWRWNWQCYIHQLGMSSTSKPCRLSKLRVFFQSRPASCTSGALQSSKERPHYIVWLFRWFKNQFNIHLWPATSILIFKLCCSIVAVHGVGGHPLNTWTWDPKSAKHKSKFEPLSSLGSPGDESPKSIMWLRDILPCDIPTARIMTFEYESSPSFNAVTSITETSKALLDCLVEKRKEESVGLSLEAFYSVWSRLY